MKSNLIWTISRDAKLLFFFHVSIFHFSELPRTTWARHLSTVLAILNAKVTSFRSTSEILSRYFTTPDNIVNIPQKDSRFFRFNVGDRVYVHLSPAQRKALGFKWSLAPGSYLFFVMERKKLHRNLIPSLITLNASALEGFYRILVWGTVSRIFCIKKALFFSHGWPVPNLPISSLWETVIMRKFQSDEPTFFLKLTHQCKKSFLFLNNHLQKIQPLGDNIFC